MKHALSSIHPGAKLGPNVSVDPFASIHNNVEIGEGTRIGSNAVIMEGSRIGKNCQIFPGAVIGAIPQDMKFEGEDSIVVIGDNTTIREFVTVNRGTKSRGKTVLGNNILLMAYSHVAHDCVLKNNVIVSNAVQIGGDVEIDDFVVIGGGTYIHQFCHIGKHVMISGMSGILTDVPPYLRVAGIPVVYQGINYIGLKRRDYNKEQIDTIHEIYRMLYQVKLNTSQAVEQIEKKVDPGMERDEILTFIKNSNRGIIRALDKSQDGKYNSAGQ